MSKLGKALVVCAATVMGLVMAIGVMHEPRHPQRKATVHEPVYSQEDIDFLMIDLEHARREAEEAYNKITQHNDAVTEANRKTMFDASDIHYWKKP